MASSVQRFVSNVASRFSPYESNENSAESMQRFVPRDIDINYITERIIGMSQPSCYTDIDNPDERDTQPTPAHLPLSPDISVSEYLQHKHLQSYLCVNLTDVNAENALLHQLRNQILDFLWVSPGFGKSQTPSLTHVLRICYAIESYLFLSPHNVVAVYCFNGKTRTGLVIACYLKFAGLVGSTLDGFALFCQKRCQDLNLNEVKTKIPPSLRTFFLNFDSLIDLRVFPNPYPLILRAVTVQGVPVGDMPCLDIWDCHSESFVYSSHEGLRDKNSVAQHQEGGGMQWCDEEGFYRVNKELLGEFVLLCRFGGDYANDLDDPTKILFRYANSSGFLCHGNLELPKIKVDVMKRYAHNFDDEDFLITMMFDATDTGNRNAKNKLDVVLDGYDAILEGWRILRDKHAVKVRPSSHQYLTRRGFSPAASGLVLQLSNHHIQSSIDMLKGSLRVLQQYDWDKPALQTNVDYEDEYVIKNDQDEEKFDGEPNEKLSYGPFPEITPELSEESQRFLNTLSSLPIQYNGMISSPDSIPQCHPSSKSILHSPLNPPHCNEVMGMLETNKNLDNSNILDMLFSHNKELTLTSIEEGLRPSIPLHRHIQESEPEKYETPNAPEKKNDTIFSTTFSSLQSKARDSRYFSSFSNAAKGWLRASDEPDTAAEVAATTAPEVSKVEEPEEEPEEEQSPPKLTAQEEKDRSQALEVLVQMSQGDVSLQDLLTLKKESLNFQDLPFEGDENSSTDDSVEGNYEVISDNYANLMMDQSESFEMFQKMLDENEMDDLLPPSNFNDNASWEALNEDEGLEDNQDYNEDTTPSEGENQPVPAPPEPIIEDETVSTETETKPIPVPTKTAVLGAVKNIEEVTSIHDDKPTISAAAAAAAVVIARSSQENAEPEPEQPPEPQEPVEKAPSESSSAPPLKQDPAYIKYFKMLKVGLPMGAVQNCMTKDGLNPAIMDLDHDKPLKDQKIPGEDEDGEDDGIPLKDDPNYVKYFKMLKVGLPMGAVKNCLTKDGLDPGIMDLDPEKSLKSQQKTDEDEDDDDDDDDDEEDEDKGPALKDDPEYVKYFKMLKVGLPMGAVKNCLMKDGLDPEIMDLDPEKSLRSQRKPKKEEDTGPPLKDDPAYVKYFKMLKVGLPLGAVKNCLAKDGLDPSIMDLDPEKSLKSQLGKEEEEEEEEDTGPPLKDDPEYVKYFKMLKVGLPLGAVKNCLTKDGLDPSIMDLDPEKSLKSQMKKDDDEDGGVPLKDDPDYAKYFKMLKMGLPMGAVQNALVRDGKDPKIMDLDPEKSVASQQKKKKSKMKKSKSKKKAAAPKRPKVRRKKIFWTPIEESRIRCGSIWAFVQENIKMQDLKYDPGEFESLFTESATAKPQAAKNEGSKEGKPKKSVQVIDGKKGMNGGIILARLKIGFDELASMVDGMDAKNLDATQLTALQSFLPTDEEAISLKSFLDSSTDKTAALESMCTCEKYMVAMLKVSNAKNKFDCMLFKFTFRNRYDEFMEQILVVIKACREVRESLRLRRLMAMILQLGNTINTGGVEGVKGFSLDALLKLDEAKAFDKKTSVLQYLVKLVKQNDAELLKFKDEIETITTARGVTTDTLISDIKELNENLQHVMETVEKESPMKKFITKAEDNVLNELNRELEGEADNTIAASTSFEDMTPMQRFVMDAKDEVQSAFAKVDEMKLAYDDVLKYFGEDEGMASHDFFGTLDKFVEAFGVSHEEVKRVEAEKIKQEKRAEKERLRLAAKKVKAAGKMLSLMKDKVKEKSETDAMENDVVTESKDEKNKNIGDNNGGENGSKNAKEDDKNDHKEEKKEDAKEEQAMSKMQDSPQRHVGLTPGGIAAAAAAAAAAAQTVKTTEKPEASFATPEAAPTTPSRKTKATKSPKKSPTSPALLAAQLRRENLEKGLAAGDVAAAAAAEALANRKAQQEVLSSNDNKITRTEQSSSLGDDGTELRGGVATAALSKDTKNSRGIASAAARGNLRRTVLAKGNDAILAENNSTAEKTTITQPAQDPLSPAGGIAAAAARSASRKQTASSRDAAPGGIAEAAARAAYVRSFTDNDAIAASAAEAILQRQRARNNGKQHEGKNPPSSNNNSPDITNISDTKKYSKSNSTEQQKHQQPPINSSANATKTTRIRKQQQQQQQQQQQSSTTKKSGGIAATAAAAALARRRDTDGPAISVAAAAAAAALAHRRTDRRDDVKVPTRQFQLPKVPSTPPTPTKPKIDLDITSPGKSTGSLVIPPPPTPRIDVAAAAAAAAITRGGANAASAARTRRKNSTKSDEDSNDKMKVSIPEEPNTGGNSPTKGKRDSRVVVGNNGSKVVTGATTTARRKKVTMVPK